MFHGDGSVRVPGKCVQCAEETSDVEEDLCRTCLPDMHQSSVFGDSVGPTSGEVQNMDVLLAAAAASPLVRTVTTPTSRAVHLQTVVGVLSPDIPVVAASPPLGTPPNRTASASVEAKKPKKGKALTEAQAAHMAAQKKLTDKNHQQRRNGKMKALLDANVAYIA